ncbi:hypothetical protein [Actinoplanes sp. NPDC026670]|uniref:hypothetical protein n=1 Tax=Actinoplanes sp. NPDC026670 TaxID=3154700 RepID=UPI003405C5AF
MKIGIRNYMQGMGRWLAIAGALLVVALLATPIQAPEPGGDHPYDMNCGNIFWLTPPKPDVIDPVDPEYEFYREKMDRGCQEARFVRGATVAVVSVITVFGVALLARRQDKYLA